MDHEILKQKLFALHDKELPASERVAVEAHLSGCYECRLALRDWEKISHAFFAKQPVAPSEVFVEQVMAKLDQSVPSPWWIGWARWFVPVVGLAGVAFFLSVDNPLRENSPATENILLASAGGSSSLQWIVSGEEPEPEELVGLNLEVL